MPRDTIYAKTQKARDELRNRDGSLSMIERRLLIMTDGKRTSERISQMSRVADYENILTKLELNGYLTVVSGDSGVFSQPTEAPLLNIPVENLTPRATETEVSSEKIEKAREFMLGMMQIHAASPRNANLRNSIQTASSIEELKSHLDPWYRAISDNPYAIGEVDQMRSTLVEMLL